MSIRRAPGTLVVNLEQGYFGLCCETSLKVKVGNIGPWSTKSPSFRRRHRPYAVRRGRSDRTMLPAHGLAGRALATCSVRPADQPLQYQRITDSSAVSAWCWASAESRPPNRCATTGSSIVWRGCRAIRTRPPCAASSSGWLAPDAATVSRPRPVVGATGWRAYAAPRAQLRLRCRRPGDTAAHTPLAVPLLTCVDNGPSRRTADFVKTQIASFFTQDSG